MYNGSTIKYSVSFRTVAVDGVVSFFFFGFMKIIQSTENCWNKGKKNSM